MTNKEKREALVAKVLTREGKNRYSMNPDRYNVATGVSDCSSVQWWAHKQVLGIDIGDYTAAQIESNKLATVSLPIAHGIPAESLMAPGDLLFFRGDSHNYPDAQYVGHVEMYMGNGMLIGHNSGTMGPTRKDMVTYCRNKQNSDSSVPAGNKGLICVRRAVPLDASDEENNVEGDFTGMNAEQFVKSLYVSELCRKADAGGLQFWLNKINNGASFLDVYKEFTGGDENITRFVTEMYVHVFNRQPDAGGLQYWVGQIKSGMSRADAFDAFTNGPG